ncbi:MAG: hypothetical protein IPK24_13680 [Kineosporiaceae bacterium]|nr:hypothetical protein [Kineosporiaceae bacterium]MBK8076575.1 hypothetical protein [Kineosporiaceae bacterium]
MSSTIMGIGALVVASLVFGTLGLTADSGRRTAAANLAASQAEALRQVSAVDIPDGRVVLPTQTVGGTVYTITQDATYTTYNGAVSACTGTGRLAAKRVTVTVTWANMGNTEPVTTETMRSLGFNASSGGLDTAKGSLAAYVLDSSGSPVPNAQVVLRTSSGTTLDTETTGADGCAVFTNLSASSNVYATASRSGMVDISGLDSVTDTGSGIVANSVIKTTLSLGEPGSLTATLVRPSGTSMPASYGANAFQPYLTTTLWPSATTRRSPPNCATATPSQACLSSATSSGFTATRLFPAAYGAWAGSCQDARPASLPLTSVVTGQTANVNVSLAGVRFRPDNAAAVGKTVTATHAADAYCAGGEVITLGVMPAMGNTSRVALPPGAWTLTVPSGTRPQSVSLTAGNVSSTVSVG